MYLDENDYQSHLNRNRKDFKDFSEKIKKDVRENGVSHCGQFTTEEQVDKAFAKHIKTGLYN